MEHGYPNFKKWEVRGGKHNFILPIVIGLLLVLILINIVRAQPVRHISVWRSLVAEDCVLRPKNWTYEDQIKLYTYIACVVRNRQKIGLNNGLVSAKRKNLDKFCEENDNYILAMRGWSIIDAAITAHSDVFFVGVNDITNGATHYEHTGRYPIPRYAKKMRVVKKLFQNTKNEITFWKG